ncbi:MAG TPA: hypothetical protein DDY16_05380 [Tenacibaculum sp.]|nr:hypothetical protein [Tenacibaculum sp.]
MRNLVFLLLTLAVTSYATGSALATEVSTENIIFKENSEQGFSQQLIKAIIIAVVLIGVSFIVLILMKKLKTKLPGIELVGKSKIELLEYKKLPANLEIYLVKIQDKTVVLAKSDGQLLEVYSSRMDENDSE